MFSQTQANSQLSNSHVSLLSQHSSQHKEAHTSSRPSEHVRHVKAGCCSKTDTTSITEQVPESGNGASKITKNLISRETLTKQARVSETTAPKIFDSLVPREIPITLVSVNEVKTNGTGTGTLDKHENLAKKFDIIDEILPSANSVTVTSRRPYDDVMSQEFLPQPTTAVPERNGTKEIVLTSEDEIEEKEEGKRKENEVEDQDFVVKNSSSSASNMRHIISDENEIVGGATRIFDFGNQKKREKESVMTSSNIINESEIVGGATRTFDFEKQKNREKERVMASSSIINESETVVGATRTFDFGSQKNREKERVVTSSSIINESETVAGATRNFDFGSQKKREKERVMTSSSSESESDDDVISEGCEHKADGKCWPCYLLWSAHQPLPQSLIANKSGCICDS